WFASPLALTAFLGVLCGLAVEAGVDKLERYRIRRGVGAAIIVVTFFLFLFGIGAWLTPTIRAQSVELRAKIPEAVDRIELWLNRRQHGFFGFVFGGKNETRPADTAAPRTAVDSTATAATVDTVARVADSTHVGAA